MRQINLKAMAKINLSLDVTGERENGYHDLRMVMQSIRLYDRISLNITRSPGVKMETNLGFLPVDANNLAAKAAKILIDEFQIPEGVFISLEKHIPVAAGMAGGSSDAAAVLVGMNILFHLGLSQEKLMERGLKIGADVPFCILRGIALAEGIGEILTPLPHIPDCLILVAKPEVHVSTKYVYSHLVLDEKLKHPDIDGQIQAIREGNLREMCRLQGNVLESVTVPMHPEIGALRDLMLEGGAIGAMMSGSGPTIFGIFDDEKAVRRTREKLIASPLARQTYLTTPYYPER